MKKTQAFPARFLIVSLALLALHSEFVSAQTLAEDTLAVRVLLDENALTAVPVSAVATIDTSGRVVALDLSGRNLVKVTSEIGAMTGLKSLVLSNNLIDSLPAEVWDLQQLVSLDLSGNHIASLDARVGSLSNLLFLGLRANALTALPPALFTLPNLEVLLLSRNALDTLPEGVADLVFLKYLNVSSNRLRTVPDAVAAMDHLDSLDLSGNSMTALPAIITGLTHPKVYLGDNQLCALSAEVSAWATARDPSWASTQTCGIAVRPVIRGGRGALLRAREASGNVFLDFPAAAFGDNSSNTQATYEIALMDAAGRVAFRARIATGRISSGQAVSLRVGRGEMGSRRGRLWAELRSEGRILAAVPVLPAE